jgi:DNA-binding NarL/FixJ family response regulator
MPVEQTRIVLINMTPLLREIVGEAVDREPDLELVGEHEAAVDVRAAVEHDKADFVIVGADSAAGERVRALVGGAPGLRALELRACGKESVLYELRPHRVALGEISPATLLQTIRAVPTWDAEP